MNKPGRGTAGNEKADWTIRARRFLALMEELLSGSISIPDYRTRVTDTSLINNGPRPDADPVYVILEQVRYDAIEFVPSDDVRDAEDMSPEELRMRAGFARDAIAVTLWYEEHARKKRARDSDQRAADV